MLTLLSTLVLLSPTSTAAEAPTSPTPPPRSRELSGKLRELEGLLGTWEVSAEWSGGQTLWARSHYEVGIGGTCIEGHVWVRDGDGEPYERYFSVLAHDAEADTFRLHTFHRDGRYESRPLAFDGNRMTIEWEEGGTSFRDHTGIVEDGILGWTVEVRPPGAEDFQVVMQAEWERVPREARTIDASLFDSAGVNTRSFSCEKTIEAPIAEVYRAFTDDEVWPRVYDATRPELAARIDLSIGGRYEWLWDGALGSNDCQVLSFVPDRMLSFSWNAPPSQPLSRAKRTWVVVDFRETESGGTLVRVTHLGFDRSDHWSETFDYFQKAWPVVLGQFAKGLETDEG